MVRSANRVWLGIWLEQLARRAIGALIDRSGQNAGRNTGRRLGPLSELERLCCYDLFDLGDAGDLRLSGIFSPGYSSSTVSRYVHDQFLELAARTQEKCGTPEDSGAEQLIRQAFERIGLNGHDRQLAILDVGSGAGNSVIPLLRFFPDALVIASDISTEMLVLLKKALKDREMGKNCVLVQLNAEDLFFIPGSFDLVVGFAILHHLFSPEKVVRRCAEILKPGGFAIFFEPFENGNDVVALIYRAILTEAEGRMLSGDVKAVLEAQCRDFAARRCRDKSLPIFLEMDDKWLFTEEYFHELAQKYGFASCMIYSLHQTERMFERQIEGVLRIATGKAHDALPEWAWEIVREYDSALSDEAKDELLIEACVILEK